MNGCLRTRVTQRPQRPILLRCDTLTSFHHAQMLYPDTFRFDPLSVTPEPTTTNQMQ